MMAFALLLGMTQCKKEQVSSSENNGVNITLKVDGGSEKLNVYPATGAVIFTAGDEIYVGNNGKYVGTLTFENGLFQGTIESEDFSTDDFLHFYFVGNSRQAPPPTRLTSATNPLDCRPFRMRPQRRNTRLIPRPTPPDCSTRAHW